MGSKLLIALVAATAAVAQYHPPLSDSLLHPQQVVAINAYGGAQPVSLSYMAGGSATSAANTVWSFRNEYFTVQYTYDIRLCYLNGYISTSNVQTGPGNAATLTAGLEYNSHTVQVTWRGASSISVPDGGEVCSDVIATDIPANTGFFVRHALTVSAAQNIQLGTPGGANSSYTTGSDVTTATGAMATPAAGASVSQMFAVLGTTAPTTAGGVLALGDSICAGTGDNLTGANGTPNQRPATSVGAGFVLRGLGLATNGTSYNVAFECNPGTSVAQHIIASNAPALWRHMSGPQYAITALGINDLGTATATIQANLVTLWTMLTNRGMKVWQTTLTPRTTSTDKWTTTANQTVTANEASRVALNDWIRTTPAPLSGYIETANTLECNASNVLTQDGGRWCVGATQVSGTSSGTNTATTLNDTSKSWTTNQWTNLQVYITGGTGSGEINTIQTNTATALTLLNSWSPSTPDATSTYIILAAGTLDGTHPEPTGHAAMATPVTSWASTYVTANQ